MVGPYDVYPEQQSKFYDTLGVSSSWGSWFPGIMDVGGTYGYNRAVDLASGRAARVGWMKAAAPRFLGGGLNPAEQAFQEGLERTYSASAVARGSTFANTEWAIRTAKQAGDMSLVPRNMKLARAAGGLKFLKGAAGVVFGLQIMGQAADIASDVMNAAVSWRPRSPGRRSPDFGNKYFDSSQAYTQRQRAVAAISNSGLTTRAAIGNEASFIHGA